LLSEQETAELRALVAQANEVFAFLPRTSRIRNVFGRQIVTLGKYAQMMGRPPQPILQEFTGLLAAAEAEIAGAKRLMPAIRR
jgi:hypothetical protein